MKWFYEMEQPWFNFWLMFFMSHTTGVLSIWLWTAKIVFPIFAVFYVISVFKLLIFILKKIKP
jgi:hypothetical protein